jgi:hypothetical protein|tara:strand:- start:131 stop:757 length:627 start_codon:yes stop_codon:yes gene_type:complete
MAYNIVSGSILAAQEYKPGGLVIGNIVSGNLSTSNGAEVINVPRISNATNNSLVTNVGDDANIFTCESNLKFDGSALALTGELTASIGVKASFFEGDGSRLTGIAGASLGVEQYGAPPLGTIISSSAEFVLIKSGSATGLGGATYILPTAAAGKKVYVKLSASVANVTVAPATGDRIEGATTGDSIYLESTGSAVTLVAFNTSDWWVV